LGTFAREWLATRADLSPQTRALYEHALARWILPRVGAGEASRGIELGTMHIGDISPATIRTWYAAALTTARARIVEQRTADAARRVDPARTWARAQGMPVAPTGRLSPAVVRAWQDAGRPMPPRPVVDVPENAGRSAVTNAYRLLRAVLN